MSTPIFAITDGTKRVDFTMPPFGVRDWFRQGRAQAKGGGSWRDSPLADGRAMVMRRLTNLTTLVPFSISATCDDTLWSHWQALISLLEKATAFWTTDWQSEPVWIERRSAEETGTAYAVVKDCVIPDLPDPVTLAAQIGQVIIDGTCQIEHGMWQSDVPGSAHSVQISSTYLDHSARTQGRAATTLPEVYVANKHNLAALTHLFRYDSSTMTFSANQIGAALPYDLFAALAAGPDNGDITYFGVDTAVANDGPFSSLVFDIGTAATYGAGDFVTWEYWNGAWVSLATLYDFSSVTDWAGPTTKPWERAGVVSMHWLPPADWTTTAINLVTAWWIRCVVTEATGITRAQQQTRDVYTLLNPYFDIDEAQLPGDYPALCRYVLLPRSDWLASLNEGIFNRVIIGSRTLSRGTLFDAYLNLTDVQMPAGHSISLDATCSYRTDPAAPTGRCVRFTAAGAMPAWDPDIYYSLSTSVGLHYQGIFHAYLRYKRGAGGTDNDVKMRLSTSVGGTVRRGQTGQGKAVPILTALVAGGGIGLLDMGLFSLPPGAPATVDALSTTTLWIEFMTTGVYTVDLFDLILIPADESFVDADSGITDTGLEFGVVFALDFDAATHTKAGFTVQADTAFNPAGPTFYSPTQYRLRWAVDAAQPLFLQTNTDQRVWFLSHAWLASATPYDERHSEPHAAFAMSAQAICRYDAARGTR